MNFHSVNERREEMHQGGVSIAISVLLKGLDMLNISSLSMQNGMHAGVESRSQMPVGLLQDDSCSLFAPAI